MIFFYILIILGHMGTVEDANNNTSNFESSFMKKRKATENVAGRRHREKMERQDRYLQLLERLTTAVEKMADKETK